MYPTIRKPLFVSVATACVFAFPQLFLIKLHSANTIVFKPGFLLENMLTVKNEAVFWFINLGLALFLIPLGFYISSTEQKKFFILIAPLFLIPNLIHLSSRFTFDDHKYFNLWIIGANMFTASFIAQVLRKNMLYKLFATICIVLLTLSGCISIMVIKNDISTRIPDYAHNAFLAKIKVSIPNNQVILINGEIYDPATLVGKKHLLADCNTCMCMAGMQRAGEK